MEFLVVTVSRVGPIRRVEPWFLVRDAQNTTMTCRVRILTNTWRANYRDAHPEYNRKGRALLQRMHMGNWCALHTRRARCTGLPLSIIRNQLKVAVLAVQCDGRLAW